MQLTDRVGILKMSRIQFVDCDTSSEDDDTCSGVVIKKHEMCSKFEWWNPVGVSCINEEIEGTDAGEGTTETQKEEQVQDQWLHEVQEKLTDNEDESNSTNDTEEETDKESVNVDNKQGETDGGSVGSDVEQIEMHQESEIVDDKHKDTGVILQNVQPQGIKGMEQEIAEQINQREEISNNEKEVTDMDKNFKQSIKDTNVATQNKSEQETGEEKEDSLGKDKQLDDTCDTETTSAQRNVALDEGKEECADLQHVDDKDQENLTPTENESTHLEVVEALILKTVII